MTSAPCEISWFSALCDDDYEFLGVPDERLQSSWEHCRDIVLQAEAGGFDNILLPSGYELGIDTTAIATQVRRMRLLMAVRIGEMWPPQLARQIATIDRILGGRLTVNIISSDMPGEKLASAPRYARTVEAMSILKTMLNGEALDHQGEFWNLKIEPPRVRTHSGKAPLLYFGGLSEDARDAAAKGADVFLMWPDRKEAVADIIADMTARAARYGRTLRFGYRAHVVVRDTESEARTAADRLLSKLDNQVGAAIKANQVVKEMGLERKGLVEEDLPGYHIPYLDGLWLRAPYLHNGSVPTLHDLLEPAAKRPKVFWRGYDVYDQKNVGFVTDTPEAQRVGTKFDITSKGSGNQGHEFGTGLSASEKDALVEYLKTL